LADGKENKLTSVAANQETKADYKTSTIGYQHTNYKISFAEATDQFFSEPFLHKENKYDEYTDQVLLPHEFSRSGPFIGNRRYKWRWGRRFLYRRGQRPGR
jgi:hypothetical protein